MTTRRRKAAALQAAKPVQQQMVRFELAAPTGSTVSVAGSFNNWDPQQHPMCDNPCEGIFAATVPLCRGRHEYKFVVNGEWCTDPKCSESVPNACGTLNSVVEV
jgi:1,4-alpha-glucan branching enzyme